MQLKDKVALVTGGSRGIGRACAVELARRGANVVLTFQGNEAAAAEAVKACVDAGGKAKAVRLDVADTAACTKTVDDHMKEYGRLDVLVNNAGISIDGLIMRFRDEDWDKTMDTNLRGAWALIRAGCRPMMKQRGGSIINLSSVVGEMGNVGQSVYAASKAGLIGITKSLARELASRNIRVNAVTPGFITTDMTAGLPEEMKKGLLQIVPLQRLGTAEEVAKAVAFLASDDASYITGEVLKVNGGMYM
ncbi:MAG: 3-oxoacyl-[acyl-carrier-protein] reductase [Myxococcaceae bacterium]